VNLTINCVKQIHLLSSFQNHHPVDKGTTACDILPW